MTDTPSSDDSPAEPPSRPDPLALAELARQIAGSPHFRERQAELLRAIKLPPASFLQTPAVVDLARAIERNYAPEIQRAASHLARTLRGTLGFEIDVMRSRPTCSIGHVSYMPRHGGTQPDLALAVEDDEALDIRPSASPSGKQQVSTLDLMSVFASLWAAFTAVFEDDAQATAMAMALVMAVVLIDHRNRNT